MLTKTTATTRHPRSRPSNPPKIRSKKLSPTSFMIQRAILPAMPARIITAKKMIRNPAMSPNHIDFK